MKNILTAFVAGLALLSGFVLFSSLRERERRRKEVNSALTLARIRGCQCLYSCHVTQARNCHYDLACRNLSSGVTQRAMLRHMGSIVWVFFATTATTTSPAEDSLGGSGVLIMEPSCALHVVSDRHLCADDDLDERAMVPMIKQQGKHQ